ncbi:TOBE domain-containing protein [Clostridium butyricum]|uniref:TOBE domain-containing protein n=1 Tax=Clostridium butyricum TaxID=1492 RepID=UPI00168B042C|nr:TOBE domain-containing protein [Clostridium butyricum]MDB2152026.1 TOBE domain-containing protein [Clostridium butyricum]
MKISARNQFKGTIKSIKEGSVNSIVTITLGNADISATISMDAVKELELEIGKEAYAIVKATEVMVACEKLAGLSARNQLEGTIESINEGAVNAIVKIACGDYKISSTVSIDAVKELELSTGKTVYAIIKATSVMVGV